MTKTIKIPVELERLGPPRRSANFLRERIAAKGWALSDLAFWMGISRQHLYEQIANLHRPKHWDWALEHVPRLTRAEMKAISDARKQVERAAAQDKIAASVAALPGFRYHGVLLMGAIVAATTWIGEIAVEGEEGVIAALRSNEQSEEYLVRFPHGEEWFDPDTFDAMLVDTGQTATSD